MPERPPAGTRVCALQEIPDGAARMFVLSIESGEFRLLILRSDETCFGFENSCPHFGIPLAARNDQLIFKSHQSVSCNTHYARFRWNDGFCESGDCAGESLVVVQLVVANGHVWLA